ncbi:MAG: hypothetical protein K6A74_08385, partial [Lachnospiraceae bacterium]|nr:hypothetical protein [Lachnospiraceae bacterium]
AKKTGATLIQGVDYEVSYSNTVNAGKATVTITGKGSYSGTVKKTYTIAAYNISSDPDSLMTLKVTDNVTMMKGGAKPGVKLTYDGTDLVEGKDYKLTYSNNTSVGGKNKPAVTIKGCGNFAGTITKNYVIEQQSIYSLSISVKDVQYSPKAGKYKSVPTITDLNGKTLKSGTDYNNVKYTYENETILPDGTTRLAGDTVGSKDILPVGTVVRVSATGKGSYAGTISTTYRIVKCSIANAKITVKNQEYTGKAVIPDKEDIVVKVNGVTLSSDEFEIISCSNNVNKGSKAKLTIRGLNAYGGVKSRTFTIKSKVFKWWWE